MKILFLTPWYPDDKNKVHGIFVREQALALASHHEVIVISSKVNYARFGLGTSILTESVFQNLKEYRLIIDHSFPLYNQFNYFFISLRAAIRISREFSPDIIHGNIGYQGGFWSWLLSKWIRKPYIVTEHTFIYNNFRSYLHRKLTLFSLARASAVITVGQKAAQEIKKYISIPLEVVPNIIDASRFSIQTFPSGSTTIGFLGGLSSPNHVKGLDVLLRVASKIKADFILHIGGDGKMKTHYETQARNLGVMEKCRFLGYVSYDQVPEFMNNLHFFLNTSRFESFGIAMVEAMASGLPVICFDNGGPSDFMNPENGLVVEDQNEEKLKESIEWMLQRYSTFDRKKIRSFVGDKFSREAFVKSMDSIYQRVLNKSCK